MNNNDFIIWLKGFMEACKNPLTLEQMNIIKQEMNNIQEIIVSPIIIQYPWIQIPSAIPNDYPQWEITCSPNRTYTTNTLILDN